MARRSSIDVLDDLEVVLSEVSGAVAMWRAVCAVQEQVKVLREFALSSDNDTDPYELLDEAVEHLYGAARSLSHLSGGSS